MNHTLFRSLAFFALGVVGVVGCLVAPSSAFGADLAAPSGQTSATASKSNERPHHGVMYRVRHNGHVSYLMGSIHVGQEDLYPLDAQTEQALTDAEALVLEFDTRDTAAIQSAIQKYGMYGPGDTLDKHLSKSGKAELDKVLTSTGMPYSRIEHFKPWMVADLLLVMSLERNDMHAAFGTEAYLLSRIEKLHKPVLGLESAEYQMHILNSPAPAMQEQYLLETIKDLNSGEAVSKTKSLLGVWSMSDSRGLELALKESEEDKSPVNALLTRLLLDDRNPGMAKGIEKIMEQHASCFVAIGSLHLIGPKSVPAMLAQHGYEVEKLY